MRVKPTCLRLAVSAVAGAAATWALWHTLHAPPVAQFPRPARVAVKVRAAAPAPAPAAAAPVERKTAVLPLRGDLAAPRAPKAEPKVIETPKPKETQPASPQVVLPVAPVNELPTIGQPVLPQPARATHLDLPTIQTADAPPVPEEPAASSFTLASTVRPGGTAMVLGVLVNDQGVAIKTAILVPSMYALQDVSASMANIGRTWFDLNPPLQPGEERWLELLLDHGRLHPVANPLP